MSEDRRFLDEPLRVINVGLELFAEDLKAAGVEVIQVDWRPPSGGNPRLAALLAQLEDEE
jgi:FdrA protein